MRFTKRAHAAATYRDCRRPLEGRVGCGGRVMWENDPYFPLAYFGLTGTCLHCAHKVHTQELLAPPPALPRRRETAFRYVEDRLADGEDGLRRAFYKAMEGPDA